MPKRALAPLALALLAACGKPEPQPSPAPARPDAAAPAAPAPAAADGVTPLAEALGDVGTLALVIRPGGWADAKAKLVSLAAAAPSALRSQLAESRSALEAALSLALDAGVPEGWDAGRPWAIGLGEPTVDALEAAVGLLSDPAEIDGLHHRLVVPASDVDRLIASLTALAPKLGLPPDTTRRFELEGGHGFQLDAGLIAFRARGSHVIVDVVDEPLVPESGQKAWLAAWRKRLSSGPAPQPPDTPAWRFATRAEGWASAHVRPWKLRSLYSWLGLRIAASALSLVDPDRRTSMLSRALTVVLNGWVVMAPTMAEVDDVGVSLAADTHALRLTWISSLTGRGAKAWEAAQAGGKPTRAFKSTETLARMTLRASIPAALEATQIDPHLEGITQGELLRLFTECGFGCYAHFFVRGQLPVARLLTDAAGEGLAAEQALGLSVAFVGADPTGGEGALRLAMAARYPEGTTLETLRRSIGPLFELPKTKVDLAADGVLLVGLNADPANVFAESAGKTDDDALATLSISTERVAAVMDPVAKPVAATLATLDRVEGRLRLVGRTTQGEVVLTVRGAKAPAGFAGLPEYSGLTWRSPDASAAGKAGGCLTRAVLTWARAVTATDNAAPADRDALLAKGVADTQPLLACAEADPEQAQAARSLRALEALLRARRADDRLDAQRSLSALGEACDKGVSAACLEAKRRANEAERPLARVGRQCERPILAGSLEIWTGAEGWTVDGKPFKPEGMPAFAARINESVGEREGAVVLLTAADDAPMSVVIQATRAAITAGARVELIARGPEGVTSVGVRIVEGDVPDAPPAMRPGQQWREFAQSAFKECDPVGVRLEPPGEAPEHGAKED